MPSDWFAAGGAGVPAGMRSNLPGSPRAASAPSRLTGGCAAAFAGLALVAAQPRDSWLGRIDTAVIGSVADTRTAAAVRAARAVSSLAEPGPVAVLLAAAAAAAVRRAGWREGCAPFLAVATGMTARRKLSGAVGRQRPPAAIWLAEPEGFSLPSKHTALAALTAGACASALGAGRGTSQAAALLAAAGVGAGRVCLGVHWPSDVLAGWLFAAGWLDLCRRLQPATAVPGSGPGTPAHQRAGRTSP
jgi:membrane-associated phospholipid phosphatase